jgi:hypothetical protein
MGLFKRKPKPEEAKPIEDVPAPRTVVIRPNQVFSHAADGDHATRYEPGNEYEVPAILAAYFAGNGWLEGTTPPIEEADLSVDSAHHGVTGGL